MQGLGAKQNEDSAVMSRDRRRQAQHLVGVGELGRVGSLALIVTQEHKRRMVADLCEVSKVQILKKRPECDLSWL